MGSSSLLVFKWIVLLYFVWSQKLEAQNLTSKLSRPVAKVFNTGGILEKSKKSNPFFIQALEDKYRPKINQIKANLLNLKDEFLRNSMLTKYSFLNYYN